MHHRTMHRTHGMKLCHGSKGAEHLTITVTRQVCLPAATNLDEPVLETVNAAAAVADAKGNILRSTPRLGVCFECSGAGRVTCKECEGRGFLQRGGYNKKNPVNLSRVIGSKWTAMTQTLGWRHFTVTQQRKLDKQHVFLLLQASCDSSAQLWVNVQSLKSRQSWAAGWLQMSEIADKGLMPGAAHKCQSCTGLGYKACQMCDGSGKAQLVLL